jgi:hypothetical protein
VPLPYQTRRMIEDAIQTAIPWMEVTRRRKKTSSPK